MDVPGSPFGSNCGRSPTSAAGNSSKSCVCRHTTTAARRNGGDNMALQDSSMEGVLHNNHGRGDASSSAARKRLRMDTDHRDNEIDQLHQLLSMRGRNFVPIVASQTTFHTEDVKQKTEMLYSPLTSDILVNVRNAEQISYDSGVYFIADHEGSYHSSSQGHVINFWRYSESERRLYIFRSFLFTNVMDFVRVKEILENI